ncbi:hypothetical protein SteCoe_1176 [Stentor coeruleus]|uniref:Uncharacterized protein n=1 Tax=Stentor coeruleus TaxID=5963 RepID=A0A1R2D2C7_9CILI|nr:hypothetical protein SteCoe_1176 [Stentor coeruleus]
MWGQREFLNSSSSEEELKSNSCQQSVSTDISHHEKNTFVPKPPPTRPITANSRIISIQKAKLLKTSKISVRVEISPFFRTHPQNQYPNPPSPPRTTKTQIVKQENKEVSEVKEIKEIKEIKEPKEHKEHKEDIEEIKVGESRTRRIRVIAKEFLWQDNPDKFDKTIMQVASRKNEITPEPKHQRVTVQNNAPIRARPVSQKSVRSSSKDFKAVTTVIVRKDVPCEGRKDIGTYSTLMSPLPQS